MTRYTNSGHDAWAHPRQRRHADWGHGEIQSLIDDRPEGEPHPLVGAIILSVIAVIAGLAWGMLP